MPAPPEVLRKEAESWVRELTRPDPVRRRAAEEALLPLGEAAADALVARLGRAERSPEALARVLVRLGRTAVPAVRSAAREVGHPGRLWAVWVLSEMGCAEAVPELAAALEANDSALRQQAARALALLATEDARTPLLRALTHPDAVVRARGAEGLGRTPPPAEVPALCLALEDPDFHVRARAMDSLTRQADARALETLRRVLADAASPLRLGALDALARIDGVEAARLACGMLEDRHPGVRTRALATVERIGCESIPFLLHRLRRLPRNDHGRHVSRETGELLARMGPVAVPPLLQALEERHPLLETCALVALRRQCRTVPSLVLREAIPPLRRLSRGFRLLGGASPEIRELLEEIEAATAHLMSLPLPGCSSGPDPTALPIPGSGVMPPSGSLPQVEEGLPT